jgi:exosortase/archaeosortase family protein
MGNHIMQSFKLFFSFSYFCQNMTGLKKLHNKLKPLEGILLFVVITLVIHYSFRFWANEWHFSPVTNEVAAARQWLADQAFVQTSAVLEFLGYAFTAEHNTITYETGSWLAVNKSCSGFKQLLQAFFLFLLFPGRIEHKLWFIPMALAVMHLMNIFRLVGVSLVLYYWPNWWEFSHDYVFRFAFYFVLFLLWVWWEEKYHMRKKVMKYGSKVHGNTA